MIWRIAEAGVLLAGLAVLARPGWVRFRRLLHLFQLDSYHPVRLLRLLGRRPWLTLAPALAGGAAALGLGVGLGVGAERAGYRLLAAVAWLVLVALFALRQRYPAEKKPLVFTGRAVRLVAVAIALAAGASVAAALLAGGGPVERGRSLIQVGTLAWTVSLLAAPAWLLLANVLLLPYQWGLNRYFVARARRKLRRVDPLVVGITGSYGKTSTKSFLEALLSRKYSVLATPKSYNTLLGVSRTINETLRFRHEVFLVEMGAYGVGEIRRTARLARPAVGVVVTVGLQHLERFGSREAIERAKGELVEELPPDGAAVLNRDDESGPRLAERSSAGTVLWFGRADGNGANPDLGARAVEQTRHGIRFELVDRAGRTAEVRTRLLGLHNVTNLLAAGTVGLHLGMGLEEIAAGLRRARPVPHRLELRRGVGGSTVIDNAYSSNPVSAHSSLEVLSGLDARWRVLVTPGIVELGAEIEPENRRFGAAAAGVCDHVVLVGEDVAGMVQAGLTEAGYDPERLHRVAAVAEVGPLLERLGVSAEDVVLFENDLPDLYR